MTKVFIGSSKASLVAATPIANYLEAAGFTVTIWDEGVFSLNGSVLDRLLSVLSEYDFAVMIWAADDSTVSMGAVTASPRDNVVFECGLFMGVLGKDRVFVAVDRSADVKIPSDFAGITLAEYDGSRLSEGNGTAAVRRACDLIKHSMGKPRHQELVGEWRSRYAMAADPDHGEVVDDLVITAVPGGIHFSSKVAPGVEPYTARGRVVLKNQIIGNWAHQTGHNFVEGVFMLIVCPMADAMYGYCSGLNETGATIYETWTLAKKIGSDLKVKNRLQWAEKMLKTQTLLLPLPEFDEGTQ